METLGKFTIVVIVILLSFLLGLLGVYVIISVATLYKLAFITQFSFVQIYGIWILLGLFTYKYNKEESKDFLESMIESFTDIFARLLSILIIWSLSFIIYNILT